MSNITNLLNSIRTAIYGKEVRSSIADAIENISERQDIADNNEIIRQSNDDIRSTNENTRQSNENLRESAESIRVSEFDTIKTQYGDAIATVEAISFNFKYEEGRYTALANNTTSFYLNSTSYNPFTDVVEFYYSDGSRMFKNKEYTFNGTLVTLIDWFINTGDSIDWVVRRSTTELTPPGTNGADIMDNSIRRTSLELSVQNELNTIGNLTTNGVAESSLSEAIKNDRLQLVDKQTQIDNLSTQLADYNFDVVTSDANGKPTHATYKRIDNTLYKDVVCSNADTNGFYRTVVENTYGTDGVTLKQTVTYTFTYNTDGVIQSKRWVVS